MRTIVQKFGGTSVREAAQRGVVVRWVAEAIDRGYRPIVVVSAMGRSGDPYATDTLLSLLDSLPEPPAAESDLLVHCGELISAVVLAGHLRQAGLDAEVMTGGRAGILTDDRHGDAQIISLEPAQLKRTLDAGRIPVVAGYQGLGSDGLVTTLGRGGSDTTAVALGAAVGAEVVEIFTDVDGIKTADPRIVPEARTIREMDYQEVFQLANLGARVIHPRAVELARQFSVPVRIRSTFSPEEGTLVGQACGVLDSWAHRDPTRSVTGVTQLRDLIQFHVGRPAATGGDWIYQLFHVLGQRGVSVDLINLFPDHAVFCVMEPVRATVEEALHELNFPFEEYSDRAKVSVVGSAIQGLPGVVGRVMEALSREGIAVLQSADSHATITLLLEKKDMEAAVRALHQQFGLDREVSAT